MPEVQNDTSSFELVKEHFGIDLQDHRITYLFRQPNSIIFIDRPHRLYHGNTVYLKDFLCLVQAEDAPAALCRIPDDLPHLVDIGDKVLEDDLGSFVQQFEIKVIPVHIQEALNRLLG